MERECDTYGKKHIRTGPPKQKKTPHAAVNRTADGALGVGLTRALRKNLERHAELVGDHAVGGAEVSGTQLNIDLSAFF
ncbi:hypothetical protein D3C73_1202520 [compost metagenome]